MWFENRFYKAKPEKNGRIVIPYEKSASSGKAILVNSGFAQLAEFNRMTENYTLNVGYFVIGESLIMGNEAKILVRPILKVNERICTLKALKNTVIKVTTISFIDHIPVTKIFEDLKITDNNEIVLNFQVPPNLESVSITFETRVRNISHQKLETLSSSQNIYMKTNSSSFIFYEDYLRKINGEYYYYVLGKNGEPIEDISCNVNLTHMLQLSKPAMITSVTDEEGKICLGALKNIVKLNINFQGSQGSSNSDWVLPPKVETVSYPSSINVLEDEAIEIPFPSEKLSENTFSLIRYNSQGKVIDNRYEHATLEVDDEFHTSILSIRDLEFGHYKL